MHRQFQQRTDTCRDNQSHHKIIRFGNDSVQAHEQEHPVNVKNLKVRWSDGSHLPLLRSRRRVAMPLQTRPRGQVTVSHHSILPRTFQYNARRRDLWRRTANLQILKSLNRSTNILNPYNIFKKTYRNQNIIIRITLSLSLSLLTFSPSWRSRSLKKLLAHVSQMTQSCRPRTPRVGSNAYIAIRVEGEVPARGELTRLAKIFMLRRTRVMSKSGWSE